MICNICFHHCDLQEDQMGFCGARRCADGRVVCENYGKLTALALDPIEKKPLRRFHPGSLILSAGSYGCNLRCPFCQNHGISMKSGDSTETGGSMGPGDGTVFMSPEALADKAEELAGRGNIGLAYTYNEPLVGYEYVRDCAAEIRARGLKNVLVTNGTICRSPLEKLLPLIDAVNVDLKAFTEAGYGSLGGNLDVVKNTIRRMADAGCHLEITTLIVPGFNDREEEMEAEAAWLAEVGDRSGAEIPLHVSRFFPSYRRQDENPTPVETVYRLAEIARRHLPYVYTGNC